MSPQYLLVLLQKIINLCTRDSKLIFVAINLFLYIPYTEGNSNDFKWLHTPNPVKGLHFTDVQLVWKYEFKGVINKIDISRTKTKQEKENVALWTRDGGSRPNRLISTDVILDHQEEEGSIILTLVMAYPEDMNKLYYCKAYLNNATDNVKNTEKELQSYKLEYRPAADIVEGRPGDDIKLKWIYNYPLPVMALVFENDRNIKTDMAYCMGKSGFNSENDYMGRLSLDRKLHKGQEEITLTILNTIVDDYNHTYNSLAVAYNGYQNSSKLFLSEIPDDGNVDKESLIESTSSTGQRSIRVDPCLLGVSSSLWFILTSLSQ